MNTSRGSVVDFEAVVEAVRSRRLGGFATDVYPVEPHTKTNFSVEDGFYFTPHIGGNARRQFLPWDVRQYQRLQST